MFKKTVLILLLTFVGLMAFSYFTLRDDMPATESPLVTNQPNGTNQPITTTPTTTRNQNILSINGVKIEIEIADDPIEQSQGLSGRKSLAVDAGMLFVFPQPTMPGFWMKDMNFSLDLIWIDENKKIIKIDKNVSPETYPTTFNPPSPIKYVLEVNAGWSDRNKIKVGDSIKY